LVGVGCRESGRLSAEPLERDICRWVIVCKFDEAGPRFGASKFVVIITGSGRHEVIETEEDGCTSRVKWRNGSYFKQFGYIPTEIRPWIATYCQFCQFAKVGEALGRLGHERAA
jgi:hypothetical protein